MLLSKHDKLLLTRRSLLGRAAAGLGSVALASLLQRSAAAAPSSVSPDRWGGVVNPLHVAPRAKRVIYLYMAGGPSHIDLFDPKPRLAEMHGRPMPESFTKGQPIAQLQNQQLRCFAPQFSYVTTRSGAQVASIFPHIASIADDFCLVRSMVTEAINHDPAHTFMNTGSLISGRPSMGSWIWYGLGAETDNLPGFVVLTSTGASGQMQPIASRQWHSGFLPSRFQGVHLHSKGDAVHYINSPAGVSRPMQRDVIDAAASLNRLRDEAVDDPEIATRISQYEMAFRMQASVPELMDISSESPATLELYGARPGDGSFASNCLLARRLAERGVRFIQLYHRDWDHHGGIKRGLEVIAREVDQASAALVKDLKQRGMLDDTLVVWGGEFGRTPMAQGDGRDHHMKAFSIWLAGGGIKPGIVHGATDELGYNAVEDVVHVHDLHATMLHLLGIDHKRLTVKHQGRYFRLTDVHGRLVTRIMA